MSKSKPLKIGEVIRCGFKIPYLNPSIFIPAALCSAGESVFHFFTSAVYQPGEEPSPIKGVTGVLSLSEFIIFLLLNLLIIMFTTIVIAKMVYDSIDGKPGIREAISLATKKFIPIIIASILWGLIVLFGFILLIIPGIFLSIKLIFYMYLILFENKGIFDSLSASWDLVKGNWWRVFVLSVFWLIIMWIPSLFIVNLDRMAESIVCFVLFLLWTPWLISSFVAAYTQLKGSGEKTDLAV